MKKVFLIVLALLLCLCSYAIGAAPAVSTADGTFIGQTNIEVFLGIPYARPPIGELRWLPPQELPAQHGTYYADKYGKNSLQQSPFFEDVSEDCLYLNIRTPALDGVLRPVCVFIHGGGYTSLSGSEPLWQGVSFVKDGIVFVTINYRLGATGFLYLDEIDPKFKQTGYLGLLDQIAALKWIKKNIATFGGDPDNVTIMGESAGAASVSLLMSMPQARGLFSKAIAESGTTNLRQTRTGAIIIAKRFIELAKVKQPAELRKLSSEQLLAVQNKLMDEYGSMAGEVLFAPVSDNVQLPDEPLKAIRNGSARGVPLLAGTNRDEMNMFKLFAPADLVNFTTFRWFTPRAVEALFGRLDGNAADYYAKLYPNLNDSDRFFKAGTGAVFFAPQVDLCDAQQGNAPVYFYSFAWGGTLGAFHGIELYFVFNEVDGKYMEKWLGARPPEALRQAVHNAWAEFIKTGSPAVDATLLWFPYNIKQRPTMVFDDKLRLRSDPDKTIREYWQGHDNSNENELYR
ncbi:MAG: carboxylesterase/lipase family protein [Negativicutes bacterium]|jgi:para-nitrobenzyl esterase